MRDKLSFKFPRKLTSFLNFLTNNINEYFLFSPIGFSFSYSIKDVYSKEGLFVFTLIMNNQAIIDGCVSMYMFDDKSFSTKKEEIWNCIVDGIRKYENELYKRNIK